MSANVTNEELLEMIQELETQIEGVDHGASLDVFWIIFAAVLVFFMQAGFGMLEAGSVRMKNVGNILLKNIMDSCIAAYAFWSVGWAFAQGVKDGGNGFIGNNDFFLVDFTDYSLWFFQYAFAATTATIVSGAMSERTRFRAYLIYSFYMTAFVYPVVVHWGWSTAGWLSPFRVDKNGDADVLVGDNGLLDFAGSSIVHMVGGTAALCGTWIVGPRIGRFDETGKVVPIPGHNSALSALGLFILWFGWYGFNCGSTVAITGDSALTASKVAVTTTLSAAAGGLTTLTWDGVMAKNGWDVSQAINGVLAGLVGITAGCAMVEPWAAMVIGFLSGALFVAADYYLLHKLHIDDPVSAIGVHGCCGAFGTIMVGLFATPENIERAYGLESVDQAGLFYTGDFTQLGVQILGVLIIFLWTVCTTFPFFWLLHKMGWLRVKQSSEECGLDCKHGGIAFPELHHLKSIVVKQSETPRDSTEMKQNLPNNMEGGDSDSKASSDFDVVEEEEPEEPKPKRTKKKTSKATLDTKSSSSGLKSPKSPTKKRKPKPKQ